MFKNFSKGFREFLVKTGIFWGLFVLIQILTMGLASQTRLPHEIKPFSMFHLAEAALFVGALFLAINRKKFLRVKSYLVKLKTRIICAVLILGAFFVYFSYKKFLLSNIEMVKGHLYLFSLGEYFLAFVILFLLIVLVFGLKFCIDFWKDYQKGILISIVGVLVAYRFLFWFQGSWVVLSRIVSVSVEFLLSLIGSPTLLFQGDMPVLMFKGFVVLIADSCSGMDSILLFTFLYVSIIVWEGKNVDTKKAILFYFVGIIGAFLLNILRIFLLILIGAYLSRDFALHFFHTTASSVLFLIYFAIFWKTIYRVLKR